MLLSLVAYVKMKQLESHLISTCSEIKHPKLYWNNVDFKGNTYVDIPYLYNKVYDYLT